MSHSKGGLIMTTKQQELMTNLLRSNLLISTGCTEPIAIAYASAVARSYLKEEPSKITLRISKNMAKNAMDAGIPNSKFTGAAFVTALGALYADASKNFQLLENLTAEQHEKANIFAKENVKIEIADTDKALYIEVEMEGVKITTSRDHCRCCNKVKIVVADGHTNINSIEVNGKTVFEFRIDAPENKGDNIESVDFSMKEVFEYAEKTNDLELLAKALDLNKKLSDIGKSNSWGLNVGKIQPFGEDTCLSRIISMTTSAIDARMAGAPYPAMACTGSGNQGISTALPVYQTGIEIGASNEKILRAIAVSDLTAIYVKRNLNVLSYLCGAVIASCGASAGITYLLGGTYKEAEYAVKNVLASVTGMFCDGAKSTCAMKVLACITMAVYSANMSLEQNSRITQKVGIATENLIDTIKNIATLENETSETVDNTIMKIIVK